MHHSSKVHTLRSFCQCIFQTDQCTVYITGQKGALEGKDAFAGAKKYPVRREEEKVYSCEAVIVAGTILSLFSILFLFFLEVSLNRMQADASSVTCFVFHRQVSNVTCFLPIAFAIASGPFVLAQCFCAKRQSFYFIVTSSTLNSCLRVQVKSRMHRSRLSPSLSG